MPLIYIVEDDANIRELVAYTLNALGFKTREFAEAPAFHAAMTEQKPDLILLDIMLPGESGLDILRSLRGREVPDAVPVIMLTAKDTEYDKVIGLDAGADDYLTKPFSMMELGSRIKALLRRVEYGAVPQKADEIRVGPIRVTPEKYAVEVDGTPLDLTLKEYEVLCLLMEYPGVVFSRDTILERIWEYSYDGQTRTVDAHIRSLRRKMGKAARYIETVRGAGYRFSEKTKKE